MEELPHRSPNEDPRGHEGEQLYPGEIDLTGVVPQDDALADVIGDAITEAEGDNGVLPEWGARTMARALANRRDNPVDGALHHFAITGTADPESMARELAELYEWNEDQEVREWVNWLGAYVSRLPDQQPPVQNPTSDDAPNFGHSPEEFTANMRQTFAEADARGEPIAAKDARAVARLLAIFLDGGSELARFADSGDANPVLLYQECQLARRMTEHVPGLDVWIDHFEQHLASRSDLGRPLRPARPTQSDRQDRPTQESAPAEEVPIHGTPLEQVSAYFRIAFAEADARGEAISTDDATMLAYLLAQLLSATSEIARFAESGDASQAGLLAECRGIQSQVWQTPDITIWAQRLEDYLLASHASSSQEEAPSATTDTKDNHPRVAEGISAHGDAFRAYLRLSGTDPGRADLLESFQSFYVGFYDSLDAAVADLTRAVLNEDSTDFSGTEDGTPDELAHAAWHIVEVAGKFYVFIR